MKRKRHHNKEIEQAIKYAESKNWRFKTAGKSSHVWGRVYCAEESRDGCKISIWSTPRVPEDHANQINKAVNRCPHNGGLE